ncbi:hypothetical protein ACS3UN_03770 [Oscillospiraceae bacterium LTW-04]|nr:hypothetical protein RBH76_06695 [Oscillospiraceae bacterium MB24-C1]
MGSVNDTPDIMLAKHDGGHGMSLAMSEVARPAESRLADSHVASWLHWRSSG